MKLVTPLIIFVSLNLEDSLFEGDDSESTSRKKGKFIAEYKDEDEEEEEKEIPPRNKLGDILHKWRKWILEVILLQAP